MRAGWTGRGRVGGGTRRTLGLPFLERKEGIWRGRRRRRGCSVWTPWRETDGEYEKEGSGVSR